MYLPPHFEEEDSREIRRIVENFPWAICVASAAGELIVNHLPVIWEDDILIGHIARANSLHEVLEDGARTVFVFRAEDTYVSPNWYPTKPVTHRHVPTWNYQVVHLHGKIFFDHSDKAKTATVGKLTKLHERRVSGDKAWKMSDAPKDYMKTMLDNIVAFRVEIEKIQAKSKLSQNREQADFENVARMMEQRGLAGLAARMKRY